MLGIFFSALLADPAVCPTGTDKIGLSNCYGFIPLIGKDSCAAYVDIQNPTNTDDKIINVSSPDFEKIEVHTHENGKMVLERNLTVPANGAYTMQRGGRHIMLFGAKKQREELKEIQMNFTFENAGEVQVKYVPSAMQEG